jgi:thiamine-phosphate pyrophosphorylase
MLKALITNTNDHPFEADKINRLFNAGLDVLHLRKPHHSKDEIVEILKRIEPKYHNRIILHQHYALIKKFDLRGIHVRHEERASLFFNKLYLPSLRRSNKNMVVSATIEHIESVKSLSNGPVNCLLFSGIFNEHTTARLSLNLQKVNLKKFLADMKFPVYAMGGVTADTCALAKQLGFAGIVLQNYIWDAKDAVQKFNVLVDHHAGSQVKQA